VTTLNALVPLARAFDFISAHVGTTSTLWTYWFMMQIGMVLGYFTSYPVNWWLIRKGVKEAM